MNYQGAGFAPENRYSAGACRLRPA